MYNIRVLNLKTRAKLLEYTRRVWHNDIDRSPRVLTYTKIVMFILQRIIPLLMLYFGLKLKETGYYGSIFWLWVYGT